MNLFSRWKQFRQHPRANSMLAGAILIFLALVWGTSFILIKRGLDSFSATQVGALRLVIAGVAVIPLIWGQAHRVKREEWKWILLVGVIGNALPAVLFPLAETRLNSASVGTINVMSPIFVLIFGVLMFQLRVSWGQVVGIVLGLIGVLMLILLGTNESVSLSEHLLYASAALVATVGYGFSTNIMKRYLLAVPATLGPSYALFFMAIPYAIYLIGWGDLKTVFDTHGQTAWNSLGAITLLGLFGTALALVLFYRLIQLTSPIVAASVTYLIPLVALAWGLSDGESLNVWQYLGMAVILVGVYRVNFSKPPKAQEEPRLKPEATSAP